MTTDPEPTNVTNRSGGVDLSAERINTAGDITGRDKTVGVDQRAQHVIGTQVNVAGDYITAAAPLDHDQKDGPQLSLSTDIDPSPPMPADEQAGAKRSWFVRLKIINSGQAPATNCLGRLLEVINGKGEHLKQFDSYEF